MDTARPRVFTDAIAPADDDARGRDSLFLLATLYPAHRPGGIPAKVRNLSPGGLMAEMPEPLAPDSAIEVEMRGLGRIAGRIAWQTEGRIGVSFDREIDPRLARKPIGAGKPDNVRTLRPL